MDSNEPLGVPRGSVRAILSLILVAAFVIVHGLAVHLLLKAGEYELAISLLAGVQSTAGVVIAFYFARRP